jgi:hypothetical protein
MTARPPSVLRGALSLLSVRLVLQQIGLALLVFLLYVLWLHVPDASVLEVIGSIVLALITLAVAGAGESVLILRLASVPRTPRKILRGALLLLAGVALWLAWVALLDHFRGNDFVRAAGYVNSRFPHQLRYVFTFEHILLWVGWLWTALEWIGGAVIALFVFAAAASLRPLRAMLRALRSVACWIAVLLGLYTATAITGSLMQWTPGHGLRVEMLSLVLRLGVAIPVDATVVCFLMAILAACIRRTDAFYAAPAGTPVDSQPRTAGNP